MSEEAKTIGKITKVSVTLHGGLNDYGIEFIHQLEASLDRTLVQMGFSRIGTDKGDDVVLRYWQFGYCPGEEAKE